MAYPVAMIVENPHAEVKWLDILVGAIQVFFLRPRDCNDLFGFLMDSFWAEGKWVSCH